MTYPESEQIGQLIAEAQHILIMQADNPDADSLASALALEAILGDLGKEPALYCGVHVPDYLHYLPGWDRVSNELPARFDLSIIVDTSADSLFGILNGDRGRTVVASKPCIILDHHAVELSIPYATVTCNPEAVATGEVIYELALQLGWPVNLEAKKYLTTSIMADSQGLTTEATTSRSIGIISELVGGGVSIAELEYKRRLLMRKSPELLAYKGRLLQRIEYHADGRLATVTIPWDEIQEYSHAYNPSMLVMEDMRGVTGVGTVIAFKLYKDGKITAKIRSNLGAAIAGNLAEHFGGGGHRYASGFKMTDGRTFEELKADCIRTATDLLDALPASVDSPDGGAVAK
ncbi:MAG TPA: DHH family phosphoesterase [Candidatus Saccharimonadales bacterium]|jgi:phosphoesterase RecJ-like protein